ncbi:SWI/SNF-related matrix-associated actin-dependent regulator of chromatin subfamily A containing DEAD/H box 1 homolog [Diabrotica virgifera virgifera]|uniref:SWI/SNF-related matrix-associated actin-dependent regulator of chromatin subfamily A containing DEAD/H box 1 homolog n=1 Tax=Diabrotica virgifera virgifera TaxID=50390 RepID=A0A6P7FJC0_DIAVI|nr:SWI/SNF-related matrix-associated actin-dependent regulator of chromatin subfamily A containing DEAD/H box 1 homolog [Diabrotica virgifera virgifera]
MSDEGGPNVKSLRDFRYQKKPLLTQDGLSLSSSPSSESRPRSRILPVSSDSDTETETTTKTIHPETATKTTEPANIAQPAPTTTTTTTDPVNTAEPPQNEIISEMKWSEVDTSVSTDSVANSSLAQKSDTVSNAAQQSVPQPVTPVQVANNSIVTMKFNGSYTPRTTKNPSVLEKEKQMKFLLEIFPNLDAMKIHNCLSKHSFNTDAAAAELSKFYNKPVDHAYTDWRQDHDKKIEEAKKYELANTQLFIRNVQQTQQNQQIQQTQQTQQNQQIQQTQGVKREQEDQLKKKKVKRKKTYDSDDSTGNQEYKDDKVFDSDEDSDVEISYELTGDRKKVFDFFQSATLNELQLISTCSKKKAEAIVDLRPFADWKDLITKIENSKNLGGDLLNYGQEVIHTRNNVKHLMKKCTNLAQQLERAVAAGAGVKEQPSILSSSLKLTSYQMVGLNWLAVLYSQGVNGILADEMGLGKTVQIIAFLAHLKETGAATSTHLVIVPSSTLDNWKNEFARWCPQLRVFMYYGSQDERRQFRIDLSKGMLAEFDVILTTYTLVGNSSEERKMFRVTRMHYVIFDEAHMLKNMNTLRYENLIKINAKHRILLTGTPLQNNLLELMSLLIFVMPNIFAEKTVDLKNLFQKNSKKAEDDSLPTFEKEQIEQAKRIMKPFLLRRLKCDVLRDLPKKTDHVIHVPMTPTQKENYEQLVASYKNVNANGENSYTGMSIMTDLRKLANHPLLMRFHYDQEKMEEIANLLALDPGYKDTVVQYIVEDLMFMSDFEIHTLAMEFECLSRFLLPDEYMLASGKFIQLDKMLVELKENNHRVLIFSQYVIMLNIVQEYLRIRNYKYMRLDGSTAVSIRQDLINEFTDDPSYFIFLLSTRAGGLGINLTSADTVIIHDIDFNPYNDKQAEDRCHRMGQSRPVTVYRLISQGTIEEGMLEMNKEKLKLEREITADESDNPDVKSVVRLLSSALGIDSSKASTLATATPKKKS